MSNVYGLNPVGIGATRLTVSASFVSSFGPAQYETFEMLKVLSGSSLLLHSPQWTGSSTPAGGSFQAQGYVLGTTEAYPVYSGVPLYLSASGTTPAIAMLTIKYSQGVSFAGASFWGGY